MTPTVRRHSLYIVLCLCLLLIYLLHRWSTWFQFHVTSHVNLNLIHLKWSVVMINLNLSIVSIVTKATRLQNTVNTERIFPISLTAPSPPPPNFSSRWWKTGFKRYAGWACRRWKNTMSISMFSYAVNSSQWLYCWLLLTAYANRKLKSTKTGSRSNWATWIYFKLFSTWSQRLYDTVFGHARFTLTCIDTVRLYGEHHQAQTGNRKSLPNGK